MPLSETHTAPLQHIYAPYRVTEGTDAASANAVFVARNARKSDLPGRTTNPHNVFDYSLTKYFQRSVPLGGLTQKLTHEQGVTSGYTINETDWQRTSIADTMPLDRYESLLDDAVKGVQLAQGREVEESVFTDGWATIGFLDSIKASDLLVQTVREGQLTTKVLDAAELDPALAQTFEALGL